jgi:hypothetical protein
MSATRRLVTSLVPKPEDVPVQADEVERESRKRPDGRACERRRRRRESFDLVARIRRREEKTDLEKNWTSPRNHRRYASSKRGNPIPL